jgi:hypothetical protein
VKLGFVVFIEFRLGEIDDVDEPGVFSITIFIDRFKIFNLFID